MISRLEVWSEILYVHETYRNSHGVRYFLSIKTLCHRFNVLHPYINTNRWKNSDNVKGCSRVESGKDV